MDNVWTAVEALSTAFAAVVVLTGLLYARSQIGEAQRTRNASLLLEFHRRYHSLEMRIFRQRLTTGEFGPPSSFDPLRLSEADQYAFWRLVDELETLGIFAEKRLLDLELVIATFRSTPPRVWYYIRPWVLENRRRRPPGYSFYLEKLSARYEAYYHDRFGTPHDAFERVMALETSAEHPDKTAQSGDSPSAG
jgi:hypothetical protein